QWAVWRPLSAAVKEDLRTAKALPFFRFIGRAVNGTGRSAWRSFHFEILGTPWKIVFHDTLRGGPTWTQYIDTSKRYSRDGRYAPFTRFLDQIPAELRSQFEPHKAFFLDRDRRDTPPT